MKSPDDWQGKPADMDILGSDSNETADRIESYENNTALTNELETRLMEIDAALKKMEEGKFGICEVCGKPIEEDRLSANPAAKTCKAHMNA
ncbi:TraR/DksA C4-type zinc finger protein [Candidatus Parcubacteria bacterium]|nr:TraR/DksA C4-type zinc finger protein [Candidatus Parcubacteria bacterium]